MVGGGGEGEDGLIDGGAVPAWEGCGEEEGGRVVRYMIFETLLKIV